MYLPNNACPSHICQSHWDEWVEGSGVAPHIVERNVRTLTDPVDIDKLLNRNNNNRWKHWGHGAGWSVVGVEPETDEVAYDGSQFKPDTKVQKLENGQPKLKSDGSPDFQKYFCASDYPSQPLFLDNGIPNYWLGILNDVAEPIIITEGPKKAGAGLTANFATISISGVTNGQKLGRLKEKLKQFCVLGRVVYLCFDSDMHENSSVRKALDVLGRLISVEGAVVRVILLPKDTKGMDDFIVKYGKEEFSKLVGNAQTFEEWRKSLGEQFQQSGSVRTSNVIELSQFTSTAPTTFDETMERVRQILEIEDEARQAWELGILAKSTKGTFSANQLLNIYKIKEQNSKTFNPIDLHDFLSLKAEERQWLIAGHISVGTTLVLFADGGVGKTLLAYDLCKAIATGKPWNGFRTSQGKVLIVQTDEPEIDTRERLNIANFAAEIPEGVVQIETNWQFSQIRKLKQWIEREKPVFVMIDSFTSANRASEQQEKDASYAACLYELRDVANQYGCSIVVLHHENKAGGTRGTTAIRNNVSEVWRIRKGEPKDGLTLTQRILDIEKSRSGCSGIFKIELNVDDYSWQHQGDFDLSGTHSVGLPLSARLLNYLESRRGTRFEIEELTREFPGNTEGAVYKSLERHRQKGLLDSEKRVKQRHQTGKVSYKVFFAPILDVEVTPQNTETHTESNLDNIDNKPRQPRQVSGLEPVEDNSNPDNNQPVEVMSGFDVNVVKVAPDKTLSDFDPNPDNQKEDLLLLTGTPDPALTQANPVSPDEPLKVGDVVAHANDNFVAFTYHGVVEQVTGADILVRWVERQGKPNECEKYHRAELRRLD